MENTSMTMAQNESGFATLEEDAYAGPSTRCVMFTMEGETYGVQVKKVREVLRVGHIRSVPGSSYQVLGVINVRGVIVTVVDMRTMFNLPRKEVTDLSRIIIVELDDEQIVGMLVDFVMEVKDIPESRFEPLSSAKDNASRYIHGIAHFQEKVIILVDVDTMLEHYL